MTEEKKTKVLLFGLGAIGGFYASILRRDPSIELSVVARSNFEVVKKNGLIVKSYNHGEQTVHFDNVINSAYKIAVKYDFILICTKSLDAGWDPSEFRSVARNNTTFVLLQNGVGNEDSYREAFPNCTIISCVLWVGATQPSPGVIHHMASEHTDIGLFPNPSLDPEVEESRLQSFASMLEVGGTPFAISQDIQIERWKKLVWNIAWNPLTTLTDLDTQSWLHSSRESLHMTKRLMREVIGVARRCGVGLEYGLVEVLMERILSMEGIGSSMQTDAREGRPLEVDVILGTPMRKAREFGMDVPTLAAVYALTVAVDSRIRREIGQVKDSRKGSH